jgi:hypothetical protein
LPIDSARITESTGQAAGTFVLGFELYTSAAAHRPLLAAQVDHPSPRRRPLDANMPGYSTLARASTRPNMVQGAYTRRAVGLPPLTSTQLTVLESMLGSGLPESLQALLREPPPELAMVFPRARWVSPEEVPRIRRELGRDDWVPFLIDPQPCHEDYYCLDPSTGGPRVMVFAVHTTVAEWPTVAAWLEWGKISDET